MNHRPLWSLWTLGSRISILTIIKVWPNSTSDYFDIGLFGLGRFSFFYDSLPFPLDMLRPKIVLMGLKMNWSFMWLKLEIIPGEQHLNQMNLTLISPETDVFLGKSFLRIIQTSLVYSSYIMEHVIWNIIYFNSWMEWFHQNDLVWQPRFF